MKVGDVVKVANPKTLTWELGIIVEELFNTEVSALVNHHYWMVLVNGKLHKRTDAGLREVNQ